MKKIIAILLVLGLTVAAVCAEDAFPTGKWLDSNWNGIWEFGIGPIRYSGILRQKRWPICPKSISNISRKK